MKYDNLEISMLWAKLSLRKGFCGTHYSTTTGGLHSCHFLSSSSTLPLVFCFEACNLCCCICCCSVFKYIELTVQECFLLLLYAFYYYSMHSIIITLFSLNGDLCLSETIINSYLDMLCSCQKLIIQCAGAIIFFLFNLKVNEGLPQHLRHVKLRLIDCQHEYRSCPVDVSQYGFKLCILKIFRFVHTIPITYQTDYLVR